MVTFASTVRGGKPSVAVMRADRALDAGFDALILDDPLYHSSWEALRTHLPKGTIRALRLLLPYPGSIRPGEPAPLRSWHEELDRALLARLARETLAASDAVDARHVIAPLAFLASSSPSLLPEERRRARDAYLRLIDATLSAADRYGITLCLAPSARSNEFPARDELERCASEFRGAPLALWLDTVRLPANDAAKPPENATPEPASASAPPRVELAVFGIAIRDRLDGADGLLPGTGSVDWVAIDPTIRSAPLWCLDLDPASPDEHWSRARAFFEEYSERDPSAPRDILAP
ncbi:MAG TPA: hypothetical protein VK116_17865 [Planctomycetota bacterium]|nr:hypothetical protein [Planctomycetota bacterium]